MDKWKLYIEETGSTVDFLFYFHLKDEKELITLLKREHFVNYPVYIDRNGELNRLNHFPKNPMFQCFLLDRDNKILAVGNPASNLRIWEFYKRIINGEIPDKPPVTTVEAEQTETEAVFTLKNTGNRSLIIQTDRSILRLHCSGMEKAAQRARKAVKKRLPSTDF
jgi:hypothetical protein